MRGEFIAIWGETWREIWQPLIFQEDVPADVFCEIYRELSSAFRQKPTIEELANVIDDPAQSEAALRSIKTDHFAGERALVASLERVHDTLNGLGGDSLSNNYFNLLGAFIDKYSLRYELRRPCQLCPTLAGVFAALIHELRTVTATDAHLNLLMREFEDAIRDLRSDCSEGKIKTCIQKQVNLLEALARNCPGVTQTTLGRICDQLGSWPHADVKQAMKSLYGFANDYPGIRHCGTPAHALRAVDLRDLVAISILLSGFTPYLASQLQAEAVYRRA